MSCSSCADKGIIKLNWADAPEDYAVCLCRTGRAMRNDRNLHTRAAPLWHVWCAREQVDPSRVVMLEDVLTPEELVERGLCSTASSASRADQLLAAGALRTKRRL